MERSAHFRRRNLSQIAATAAFDAIDELEAVKVSYARNRALLLEELPRLGIGDMQPVDGAFYVYADMLGPGLHLVAGLLHALAGAPRGLQIALQRLAGLSALRSAMVRISSGTWKFIGLVAWSP